MVCIGMGRAEYFFTISMIYIDPTPHQYSFTYRSICLVLALAGHGILSKYLFYHPPVSVPFEQSQIGGKIMFYGGDVIELIIIYILCLQWYRSSKQRVLFIKSKPI